MKNHPQMNMDKLTIFVSTEDEHVCLSPTFSSNEFHPQSIVSVMIKMIMIIVMIIRIFSLDEYANLESFLIVFLE